MELNVAREVAALERMTLDELRARHVEVFDEPSRSRHRKWLIKRIIWRMQALAEGGLTERAQRRAEELANEADLRRRPPRKANPVSMPTTPSDTPTGPVSTDKRLPPPGSVITRRYKGRDLQVLVLPEGFEFEGDVHRSLSSVAKAITGSHLNGYHFFRLTKGGTR